MAPMTEEFLVLLPAIRNYCVAQGFKKAAKYLKEVDAEVPWDLPMPELSTFFPGEVDKKTLLQFVAAVAGSESKVVRKLCRDFELSTAEANSDVLVGLYKAKVTKKAKKKSKKKTTEVAVSKKRALVKEKTVDELEAEKVAAKAELEWQPKEFERPAKKAKTEKMDPIEARERNRRQDWGAWAKTIEGKDERLTDGFVRHGDTWGDRAFADLSKVKGKAFVKEMQKKKRASWRGSGAMDMAICSVRFSE